MTEIEKDVIMKKFIQNNPETIKYYVDRLLLEGNTLEKAKKIYDECTAQLITVVHGQNIGYIRPSEAWDIASRIMDNVVLPLAEEKGEYIIRNLPNNSNSSSNWSTSFKENYNNDESLKVGGWLCIIGGAVLLIVAFNIDSIILLLIAGFLIYCGITSLNEYYKK